MVFEPRDAEHQGDVVRMVTSPTDGTAMRVKAPILLVPGGDTKLYDPDKVADRVLGLLPGLKSRSHRMRATGSPIRFPQQVTQRTPLVCRCPASQQVGYPFLGARLVLDVRSSV
jgi:hypothetical protein